MSSTLRIGIIGAGGIARAAHMPGYQAQENVDVAAVCDVVPGKAAEFAEKFDIPAAYTNHTEMIERERLDAVSVCTPNAFHMETTIDALDAGLHVLCEKPIAMNVQEGRAMVDAAHKAGKILQIGLHWRFQSESQVLKRYVQAGELGDIYYGEATYWRRRGIPGWGVFTQKRMQGGGALIDIGVHTLDHTMWLMGNPKPLSVMGSTYAAFGKRKDVITISDHWDVSKFDVDDAAFAMVRFENGATLMLRATWASHVEKSGGETRILGTDGGATMSPLKIFCDRHGAMVDVTPNQLPVVRAHTKEIEHFVTCIREGTPNIVVPEQVLDVQAVIDAIYESTDTGHEVRLDN